MEPRSITTRAPSSATPTWAWVFDSDMSCGRQRDQVPHGLAGTALGAAADQHEPVDGDASRRCRTPAPSPTVGRSAARRDRRAARGAVGVGSDTPTGTGGPGGAVVGGRAGEPAATCAAPVGRCRGGVAGAGGTGAGDQAHRRQVDDVPRAAVGLVGGLGFGPDVDHDRAGDAGRASRGAGAPRSVTAVQASVASPIPNVGMVATPSTRPRSSARPTPIGVPVPKWTARSPSAALPGVVPLVPSATAKPSRQQATTPATSGDAGPHLVVAPGEAGTPPSTAAATRVQAISRSIMNA